MCDVSVQWLAAVMAKSVETSWRVIDCSSLALLIQSTRSKRIVIDTRSLFEYNSSHVTDAVNVSHSKLLKRRLQHDAISVIELLTRHCRTLHDLDSDYTIIVYDQSTTTPRSLSTDSFLVILLDKLANNFKSVSVLRGGFTEFKVSYPMMCKTSEPRSSSSTMSTSAAGSEYHRHHHHSSLSQPCLPVSNIGPTRILPFLFLGSQIDSLSKETMTQNGITYIINVSTSSPKPSFIPDGHFLRIPVNDNYCEKLTPYFNEAFQFLDKVREANGCVLIHCLAGISRSPTVAIAYVMRALGMGTDEAYRYVKDKRPTISPNFNFLGQLLEYEQQLNAAAMSVARPEIKTMSCALPTSEGSKFVVKKQRVDFDTAAATAAKLNFELVARPSPCINSPTTALSLLNFNQLSPLREHPSPGIDSADRLGFSGADCGGPGIPVSSAGVVIRLGSKHCALKRPLSIPLSPCLDVGCRNLTGNSVPDENAGNCKRTLPRPKSITLPATIQPATSRLSPGMPPSGGLTPVVPSGGLTPVGSHFTPVVRMETTNLFPLQNSSDKNMAQLRNAAKRMLLTLDTSHDLITDQHSPLAASHKSRSLEDMLTPDTVSPLPTTAGATTLQVPCSSTGVTTGGDLPVYRCHEASSAETPHHPGSGLSSAGSHSSLLDSPEIISVS